MRTPSLVSISEAAKRAGVNRTTLYRAMEKGLLSSEKDDAGKPVIRLSELARVYPQANLGDQLKLQPQHIEATGNGQFVSGPETAALQARVEMLQQALTKAEADIADARENRDRAMALLEQHLLTDQRPRKGGFWPFGKS